MQTWLFIVRGEFSQHRELKWIVTAPTQMRAWSFVADRLTARGSSFDAIRQQYNLTELLGKIDEEITIGAPPRENDTPPDDPVPAIRRLVDRRYAHLLGG